MKSYVLAIIFLGLFCIPAFAQTTDIARIEYMYIPFSKSENSIQRYRALVQAPIPLQIGSGRFLVVGLEYRYHDLDIEEPTPFDPSVVESIHQMDAFLGYTYKLNDDWRLGFKGGVRIASNLEHEMVRDDILYLAAAYAILDKKNDEEEKPYRLIFGLNYTSTPGRNFPLPLINYYREFHPQWTYTLGVPKTNIRHYLNTSKKDAFQVFITLDNFFGNIQDNIYIDGNPVVGENISMTNVLAGLGYEHCFTDHLLLYVYGAHTLTSEFRIRNNSRETAYVIDNNNSFYFRTGLKFKY